MSFVTGSPFRPLVIPQSFPAGLRDAAPSAQFVQGMLAYNPASNNYFYFDSASLGVDNGTTIIKPNDIAPGDPGRWLVLVNPGVSPSPYEFLLSGLYDSAIVPGTFDPPVYALTARTISRVSIIRRTAGTAGQTEIQLYRNGNPILASNLIVTAAMGDNAFVQTTTFNVGEDSLVIGDIIECSLEAVETYLAGPPEGPEGFRVVVEF